MNRSQRAIWPATSDGSFAVSTENLATTAPKAGCAPKRFLSDAASSLRTSGSLGDIRATSRSVWIRPSLPSGWYSARNRRSLRATAPLPFFLTAAATPKKSGSESASSSICFVQRDSSASNFLVSTRTWNSGGIGVGSPDMSR